MSRNSTAWRADGTLARLDTAFSRDQADKVYVQHRMLEAAADLWRWLQQGAHFYVCGDATRMAKDVDAALRRIARGEGGLSEAQATRLDRRTGAPGPLPAGYLLRDRSPTEKPVPDQRAALPRQRLFVVLYTSA